MDEELPYARWRKKFKEVLKREIPTEDSIEKGEKPSMEEKKGHRPGGTLRPTTDQGKHLSTPQRFLQQAPSAISNKLFAERLLEKT